MTFKAGDRVVSKLKRNENETGVIVSIENSVSLTGKTYKFANIHWDSYGESDSQFAKCTFGSFKKLDNNSNINNISNRSTVSLIENISNIDQQAHDETYSVYFLN